MPRGDARRIRNYLCQQVEAARLEGARSVTFRAGDVHHDLGLTNSYANVCQVLEGWLFHERAGIEIASYRSRPPSGRGASLEIQFWILTPGSASREESVLTAPTSSDHAESGHGSSPSTDAYDVMTLLRYDFAHAAAIEPLQQPEGTVREFMPQDHFAYAETKTLNRFGKGPFCRFSIRGLPFAPGLYAVTVDDGLAYVGATSNLARRWGPSGYANISPEACFVIGQATYCKVNNLVLEAARTGHRTDLWTYETPKPAPIESSLLRHLDPPWNRRSPTPETSRLHVCPMTRNRPAAAIPESKSSGCMIAVLSLVIAGISRLLRRSG